MSSLAVSGIVFACISGGAIFGMILRAFVPEKHLNPETKDLIKLGMGLIGTMAALVLGLVIASAKSSYDTQRNGLAQLSGEVIFLDRILAHYGSETDEIRKMLQDAVDDTLKRGWPSEYPQSGHTEARSGTEGKYEEIAEKIQKLTPKNDAQRALQAQAIKTFSDIAQTRWVLFTQKGSSIPTPFLVVMVSWLTLILASFALVAPPKPVVLVTLLICALVASSAIFLILELDRPLDGLLQISSDPLRNALKQMSPPVP
jgi:hypothetical protein